MCAYCYIRFLITSRVHERRMRIVLFVAFLAQSTPGREPTRGRPIWSPSASSMSSSRLISISTRLFSSVRSLVRTPARRDRIFHPGSLLFKLLGAQRNQTLRSTDSVSRNSSSAHSIHRTYRVAAVNEVRRLRRVLSGAFEKLRSRNARGDLTIIHPDE